MTKLPVVTIQCDWNDVIRLPNAEAWISYKYLSENSVHDKIKTTINKADGKIKINASSNFQYVSHSNLSLVFNHIQSGLRVAFVAPTKVHSVHDKAVMSVSSSDKALTMSSCEGDKVLIWDNRTGEVSLDLKGHCGPVYKCRFFPSGTVVLTAGADSTCKIWSAESGINPVTLTGHTMSVTDMCIIDKGRNVISVSKDGSAKLWDVGQSNCLGNLIEGHGIINCCALAIADNETIVSNEREIGTGNKILVSGCESGLVICAHVAKREEIFCKQMDSACNACITIEQSIIVGCNSGKIVQMSAKDGSITREWHESASPIQSLEALPNNLFIVGRQDGTCTVHSLNEIHSNTRVQLTGSDCDGIRDIAFNGKWIFAACRDKNIRKYDYNQVTVHFKTVSKQDS